jgi:hypothetical protein
MIPFWGFISYRLVVFVFVQKGKIQPKDIVIATIIVVLLYPFLVSLFFSKDELYYIIGKFVYFMTILLFTATIISHIIKFDSQKIFKLIYANVALYILMNLLLDYIGIERIEGFNETIGNGQIASLFSLDIRRRLLPLASSVNSFGIITTCFLTINFILFFEKPWSIGRILLLILSIYSLFLADTRTGGIITVLILIIYFFYKKSFIILSKWILPMLFIIPFIITFVMLSDFEFLSSLKRPGESSDAFLRGAVWLSSTSVITDFNINTLIGYGFRGNLNSGLGDVIQNIIIMDVKVPTSHNFILQTIIDFGLIGTAFYFFFIKRVLLIGRKSINNEYMKPLFLGTISIIIILVGGATEAIPSYYSDDVFILFIQLSIAIYYSGMSYTSEKKYLL